MAKADLGRLRRQCELCDAGTTSDNIVRAYTVPKREVWGDRRAGEKCDLCDACAFDAGLRESSR